MKHGFITAGAGLSLATLLLVVGGQGPTQPERKTLEAQLLGLHGGLFREHSTLPTDADSSIEQMLEQQSLLLQRLNAKLAALDPGRLEAIEQRLDGFQRGVDALSTSKLTDVERKLSSIERALESLEGSGMGDLEREVESIRRSVDDLTRAIRDLPRAAAGIDPNDLDRLARDIKSETEREMGRVADNVRDLSSSIRDLASRVRTLERRLP